MPMAPTSTTAWRTHEDASSATLTVECPSAPTPLAKPAGHYPIGSVSIDLDTLHDYSHGYGFKYRSLPDPVYSHGLPRFLDLLKDRGIRATLFVIGQDACIPAHGAVLRRAADEGHELANHTMSHPRKLASMSVAELRIEIGTAHAAINALAGTPPVGFRAPCYDVGNRVISLLREMGYRYDSSVHPTILGPLIDLVVWAKSGFRRWEARPGTYVHLLSPQRPYCPKAKRFWRRGRDDSFVELPLSVMPICRMPFYGTFAQATGISLFRRSLAWVRAFRRPLNFHFHAVELIGMDDPGVDPRFAVHPGLSKPVAQKRDEIGEMVDRFAERYELMTLAEMARRSDPSATGG